MSQHHYRELAKNFPHFKVEDECVIGPPWLGSKNMVRYPDISFFIDRIKRNETFSVIRYQHGSLDRACGVVNNTGLDVKLHSHSGFSQAMAKRHFEKMKDLPDRPSLDILEDVYGRLLSPVPQNLFIGLSDRSVWIDEGHEFLNKYEINRHINISSPLLGRVIPPPVPNNVSGDSHYLDLERLISKITKLQSHNRPFLATLWKSWAFSGRLKRELFDRFANDHFVLIAPVTRTSRQGTFKSNYSTFGELIGLPKFSFIGIDEHNAHEQAHEIIDLIKFNHRKFLRSSKRVFYFITAGVMAQWLVGYLHDNLEKAYLIDFGLALDAYYRGVDQYGNGNAFAQF